MGNGHLTSSDKQPVIMVLDRMYPWIGCIHACMMQPNSIPLEFELLKIKIK